MTTNTGITIVNLNNVKDLKDWINRENNVYIGRARRDLHLQASKWANPYKVGLYGRETAVLLYEKYLLENKELLCHK